MEDLAKRKDLIITNAEKGGAKVIMNTDSYVKEANRQLSNKASYKQLTQDLTLQNGQPNNRMVQKWEITSSKKCRWSKSN